MKNMIIHILQTILLFQDCILKILHLFKMLKINKKSFVVEAAERWNFFKRNKKISGAQVLGIDPSKNISLLAKKKY